MAIAVVRLHTTAGAVQSSRHVRTLSLLLALAPLAFSQSALNSAPNHDVIDTFLGFVGPVPANEQPRPEKFREYLMAMGGPVPLIGEAFGAGIGQWSNAPKEWGQGWGAYGKRYGSNLAYNAIRQTITYGGGLALGEDTRYFASRESGWKARVKHALLSTFTARTSDGVTRFSVANTAGVLGAGAISSVWGPPSWKGPGNIAQNAGISFASTAATNVVREFLPDILHRSKR